MPVHDWTRVDPGIFHAFHVNWIASLGAGLNSGVLPGDYYAMAEQRGEKSFEADVLTLERPDRPTLSPPAISDDGGGGGIAVAAAPSAVAAPTLAPTAEASLDFYRRKQNALVVRHASDHRMVAVIELVSPGNKSGRKAFQQFVDKSTSLLMNGVHLLIVDLFPPGTRDPDGLHAVIWDDVVGDESEPYQPPSGKPLASMAYEVGLGIRAYVRPMAVGDVVPAVPLFLEADACVMPPLEETYRTAFAAMPRYWRDVLESA